MSIPFINPSSISHLVNNLGHQFMQQIPNVSLQLPQQIASQIGPGVVTPMFSPEITQEIAKNFLSRTDPKALWSQAQSGDFYNRDYIDWIHHPQQHLLPRRWQKSFTTQAVPSLPPVQFDPNIQIGFRPYFA